MKDKNKLAKIINGNGKKSVIHWNLGANKWHNKVAKIQAIVDKLNPDFCFVTKAILAANLPIYQTNILVYEMTTPKSHEMYKFSRIVKGRNKV